MKSFKLFLLFLFPFFLVAQNINPKNVTIIRDNWGIPHVYGNTDAEAAYGLAWAQCEDNFYDMQDLYMGIRGVFSSVQGKSGALLDAIYFFVDAKSVVEEKYEMDVSPEFKNILSAYSQALNRYAELNPKQVRHSSIFPITNKDVLAVYVGAMTFMSNVHFDIIRIFEGTIIDQEAMDFTRGSNAWAISPNFTKNDETYLVANSHQPHDGVMSWYECHVVSNEGWNFYGATLGAGVTPFIGSNEHIGWTHTVNYDDFDDVYKLEMHPKDKLKYSYDGEWLELEERVLKLKIKLGPITLPVKRKFYKSVYGPTLKNKEGFYALRFPSNMVIKAAEQWFRMNKAQNIDEFEDALRLQGATNMNIVYGDKKGNIAFVGQGLFPYRNTDEKYKWQGVLKGNTSEVLWEPNFMPLDSLIYVKNPDCGYVYNMNNTSYSSTCPEENPKLEDVNQTMGYQEKETARSVRFQELIQDYDQLSYEDLKTIKYDNKFSFPLYTRALENLDYLRQIDAKQYPDLADVILVIKKWDGSTDISSEGATVMSLVIHHLLDYLREKGIMDYNNTIPKEEYAKALRFAKKHLLKHFKTVNVPLGELQFLTRGDKSYPIWGLPDALTQMYTKEWKKGLYQNKLGESYILFVKYTKDGLPQMEAINVYGSSNRPNSPHYDDQMELFQQQKLRKVYYEKDDVLRNAENAYHPK